MRVAALFMAAIVALAAAQQTPTDIKTFRKCRHTSYVAEGNEIFAVDPLTPTTKTPIQIKGVQWMGMETPDGIPAGMWGNGTIQRDSGISGTALADMLKFLYANKFNTVRLPLSARNFIDTTYAPKVTNIHGENREIALYDKGFTPKMADFVARFIGSFQKYRISVVLDIHTLTEQFAQDAFWYYPTKGAVEESIAYKTAVLLATYYCKPEYWNVMGIDLKNAMTEVDWPSKASTTLDWPSAADAIAAKVNELCPQWLVFVAGSSKGSFTVKTNSYKVWPGMNFVNATVRPLKAKNIVYTPQAFTQGVEPLGFFFDPKSNCSTAILADKDTECVVIENGLKVPNTKRALSCENSKLQCQSFTPLSTSDMSALYQRLLDETVGPVVKEAKVPVVFGSFGGVYGSSQPLQSSVLDLIIKYLATSTAGGFYASLNPDTEMWLEAPPPGNKTIGKARYGLMTSKSWQVPNADLLVALSGLKSSDIPCYGDEVPGPPDTKTGTASTSWVSFIAAAVATACVLLA
ncbi:hypothetical protein H310_04384 [Aphanomyces invadans]|uniref:Glycoside hydrolase family 5 domain-containing protein n=1 Tax=Aphanomyces invadans TaxID=157072 RepID=A0A024UC51_9STRA|nr:hypothetical protein H310_04384 [Aphanomyces invadans]ETW03976.1 hypothetical protein H310_04384 [Aphanomyces invadans]|eukprot:XP_008866932.1 hypothetical protein H310_04384 [Aphanomyces invadans]